jgi:heme/copper-type cytochrome/quinol oxidase subunit 3
MNPSHNEKKQERKIMLTMFLAIGLFSFLLLLFAIFLGLTIAQWKGEATTLSWIPLILALPINLFVASTISKKTVKRLAILKNSTKNPDAMSTEEMEEERNSEDE